MPGVVGELQIAHAAQEIQVLPAELAQMHIQAQHVEQTRRRRPARTGAQRAPSCTMIWIGNSSLLLRVRQVVVHVDAGKHAQVEQRA